MKTTEKDKLDLTAKRVDNALMLIDELMTALAKASPEIHKQLVINSKLNDFFLIRRGAK